MQDVVQELAAREPIFHRPQFARTNQEFAAMMADDYWEIGASGARYDRSFILEHLERNPPVDADAAGWRCTEFAVRQLGEATFLLTYLLAQDQRLTRRATIWRIGENGWQALYHQGTLMP